MSYVRSQEHRKYRSELIKLHKPWKKSTGPRSDEGRATVARNALKHGARSKKEIEEIASIKDYLKSLL